MRTGLFDLLRISPDMTIVEREPAGRFIPVTRIRTSEDLTQFITDTTPMPRLEAEPEQAKTLGYVVSELARNAIEHAQAENGAVLSVNRDFFAVYCGRGFYKLLGKARYKRMSPGTSGCGTSSPLWERGKRSSSALSAWEPSRNRSSMLLSATCRGGAAGFLTDPERRSV